jgi:prepilin-type N-terminal cleavage/methylation domain-containing protein
MQIAHPTYRSPRQALANFGNRISSCAAGFTVIELVVVMLVMSILAAAATPAFIDSLLFHRVESAARRVKADLELARHTARLTSAAQAVTFSGNTYTLSAGVDSFDVPGTSYVVDLSASPYELSSVAADFAGDPEITFDGYGTASSGGAVVLGTRNHECTVTLDAANGSVTISSDHARSRAP